MIGISSARPGWTFSMNEPQTSDYFALRLRSSLSHRACPRFVMVSNFWRWKTKRRAGIWRRWHSLIVFCWHPEHRRGILPVRLNCAIRTLRSEVLVVGQDIRGLSNRNGKFVLGPIWSILLRLLPKCSKTTKMRGWVCPVEFPICIGNRCINRRARWLMRSDLCFLSICFWWFYLERRELEQRKWREVEDGFEACSASIARVCQNSDACFTNWTAKAVGFQPLP